MWRARRFDVDFAPRARFSVRLTPLSALLLGAGLIAVASASAAVAPEWERLQALRAMLARTQNAATGAAHAGGTSGTGKARPAETAAFNEAQRIASDLHRPWPALFDAMEAATDGKVRVTQISVDPRFSRLQIQVEAKGLGEVVRYAQKLAASGTPVAGAQLLSHEWNNGPVHVVAARVGVALDESAPGPNAANAHAASAAMTAAVTEVR
jgi:hypothetical protein